MGGNAITCLNYSKAGSQQDKCGLSLRASSQISFMPKKLKHLKPLQLMHGCCQGATCSTLLESAPGASAWSRHAVLWVMSYDWKIGIAGRVTYIQHVVRISDSLISQCLNRPASRHRFSCWSSHTMQPGKRQQPQTWQEMQCITQRGSGTWWTC